MFTEKELEEDFQNFLNGKQTHKKIDVLGVLRRKIENKQRKLAMTIQHKQWGECLFTEGQIFALENLLIYFASFEVVCFVRGDA